MDRWAGYQIRGLENQACFQGSKEPSRVQSKAKPTKGEHSYCKTKCIKGKSLKGR